MARVLVIGFDGYEHSIGQQLIAQGRMPALAALTAEGSSVALDHGRARETGLGWEHFSTGLDPSDADRWGAVDFDPATYRAAQRPTRLPPFVAGLGLRTMVFDAPYFDLRRAPDATGLVGWGAHDPGIPLLAAPPALAAEVLSRFGPYPADKFIYGFTWPSPERTREAAAALEAAVDLRADIADWLLAERLPDWELGIVVVSEFHSAIEPFWHGVDPDHPLHDLPSAAPSRDGVERVYEAGDRLLGRLRARFPDARIVVASLHGMGPNAADVPAMALLPELLFRSQFGRARLAPPATATNAAGVPLLPPDASWEGFVQDSLIPRPSRVARLARRVAGAVRRRLGVGGAESGVEWMPAALYRDWWPLMEAFALPAYYDGRIRINLEGRERDGLVPAARYEDVRSELVALLEACTDPLTGAPAVAEVERADREMVEADGGADLCVAWRPGTLGLVHPALGTIGPLPYRRTGGHTGRDGFAAFAGPGIGHGALPRASAFDIVPTVLELAGHKVPARLSGHSLSASLVGEEAAAPVSSETIRAK